MRDLLLMQAYRGAGTDARRWLIPQELEQAYLDNPAIAAVYQMIMALGRDEHEQPDLTPDFNREKALIRVVLALHAERAELLANFARELAQRPMTPIQLPDGSTVRYVGPKR